MPLLSFDVATTTIADVSCRSLSRHFLRYSAIRCRGFRYCQPLISFAMSPRRADAAFRFDTP